MRNGSLRGHLVDEGIAGRVSTPRADSLKKYRLTSELREEQTFGLSFRRMWSVADILQLMALRCGVSPNPEVKDGQDWIDPELTVQALESLTEVLRDLIRVKGRVLIATGHPAGLFGLYARIGRFLIKQGCDVLTPAVGWWDGVARADSPQGSQLRYVDRVGMLSAHGALLHSHDSAPMRAMIQTLRDSGGGMPDLVLADHGFAGAAGAAGLRVASFADCNDPALFMGADEGCIELAIPLDDNVLPHSYSRIGDFVESRI